MEVYIYLKAKNWAGALERSKDLVKDFAHSPTALLACAYAKYANGLWSEGLGHIKNAKQILNELDPSLVTYSESPLFANANAIGQMGMGNYASALELLNKVNTESSLTNLVTCYRNLNDESKATETLELLKYKYPSNVLVQSAATILKGDN